MAGVRGRFRNVCRAALLFGVLSACGSKGSEVATVATLTQGQAATVGTEVVTLAEGQAVAAEQNLTPTEARERLIRDALWAMGAQADPNLKATLLVATRAALARAVIGDVERLVRAEGPPTDAEVAEMTAERWASLDRPETVRVTHAVVQPKAGVDPELIRRVASSLAEAVRGIADPREFIKRAKAVPSSGLDIRAEGLPAMAADGRAPPPKSNASAPPRQFDVQFAQAAHRIAQPGQQSGIIKSPFGYHVILLEKRFPEIRVPLEERRRLLTEDILTRRGGKELDRLLQDLRRQHHVEIERAADSLTAQATSQ